MIKRTEADITLHISIKGNYSKEDIERELYKTLLRRRSVYDKVSGVKAYNVAINNTKTPKKKPDPNSPQVMWKTILKGYIPFNKGHSRYSVTFDGGYIEINNKDICRGWCAGTGLSHSLTIQDAKNPQKLAEFVKNVMEPDPKTKL